MALVRPTASVAPTEASSSWARYRASDSSLTMVSVLAGGSVASVAAAVGAGALPTAAQASVDGSASSTPASVTGVGVAS